MFRPTIALIVCAVMSPGLVSQKRAVFPSNHTHREGAGYVSNVPFSSGVQRTQFVYESVDLQIPNGATIQQIGFRRNGGSPSESTGFKVQLEVLMGPSTATAASASPSYVQNYAGSPTTVFSKKVLDLPNLSGTGTCNSSFVMVPLDNGFKHDSSKNLAVEYRVYANSNANRQFSYYFDRADFLTPVSYGSACNTSGRTTPRLRSYPSTSTYWRLDLSSGPYVSATALFLGIKKKSLELSSIGMPGCFQLVDPLIVDRTKTTSSYGGSTSWTFTIPNNLRVTVHAQVFMMDLFANSLGIVASDGVSTAFGDRLLMSMIHAAGSTTSTTGSVSRSYGVVSAFDYK